MEQITLGKSSMNHFVECIIRNRIGLKMVNMYEWVMQRKQPSNMHANRPNIKHSKL